MTPVTPGTAGPTASSSATDPGTLLLIDYSSLVYRAYFSTPDTVPAHGVHGFLNMLARLLTDRGPGRLALGVDDDWRPAWRVAALPMYKAQRVSDQPDPVGPHEAQGRLVLTALGLALVGCPDYEGEDIIATLAAREAGPTEIVSGDRDLFALVRDPDVVVLYPRKGVSDMWRVDESEITAKYGIPGRAYGDFALLRGDPSDGLPGVPGIGEKTASQLIARFGSLDGLLAAPPAEVPPGPARKLAAAADYLAAAYSVVLPRTDCALEPYSLALPVAAADPDYLDRAGAELDLDGAIARVEGALYRLTGYRRR